VAFIPATMRISIGGNVVPRRYRPCTGSRLDRQWLKSSTSRASEGARVEVVGFDRRFDRSQFSCGKPDLDDWLKTKAGQQERANTTRTFVAVDGMKVAGYYATTTYRLDLDEVAAMYGVGKRTYPIPAVLLARLAVDVNFQGCGIGSKLLLHALRQIAEASQRVGFEVVVVHAIDRDAVTFYAQRGFTQFEDHDLHLFMPVKSLLATHDPLWI
jgi:predicted N-acetyltransferase YhbS